MNNNLFCHEYAELYDYIYSDKNYKHECDLIEDIFNHYGQRRIKNILDLGCGTGNHSNNLACRGYQVTGVDLSADMLDHAIKKSHALELSKEKNKPTFIKGDIHNTDLGEQFDAVLMMFAVLGYQLTNENVLDTFHTVRRHLKPDGLFLFDFWYGSAVLTIRPSDRIKVISLKDGKLIRKATGKLDIRHQLCEVNYHTWRLNGAGIIKESEEVHYMRYFFPLELEMMLKQTGMALLSMNAFPDIDYPADETTWNAIAIVK